MNFTELGISREILQAVTDMGFEEASPIQAQAIPKQLSGVDIIGQAQTGTGKTAAFGIPMLEKINPANKHLQAVVLCPTRELAIQVADEIRKLAKYLHNIKVLPIYGGQDIVRQIKALKSGVQIVVGTPGRVMDHMRRKTIRLDEVHTIVLDEADEMLDMGFIDDIRRILEEMPENRQTVLFSATLPPEIRKITSEFQRDPQMVKVVKKELTVPKIQQFYYVVKPRSKVEVLSRLIDMFNPKLSLVFCNTKKEVDELTNELQGRGYFAEGLHGDLKQAQRDRVMAGFRSGITEILIATDVAARGIDVDDVEIVFNYDIPQDEEYYVHRIGRTGRAGKEGLALSLVSGREVYKIRDIQRYCKTTIKERPIPSVDDVTEIKTEHVLNEMADRMEKEDLSYWVDLLDRWLAEADCSSLELAAAFLKSSLGEYTTVEEEPVYEYVNTGARDRGMVRLFINLGKKQKIRPGDLVGAIAGESGMPGKLIGSIDMYDKFTFVEVPEEYAASVLKAMHKAKIKGKTFNIEPASPR